MSQLLALEAVFRHASVTDAARELNLTQSTVSRLVQNLEAQLGRPLFFRERKRLRANDAVGAYVEDVTRALDAIQRASMALIANPGGGTLSLAVLPTFGTRWLGPRLARFLQSRPGVSVNLATRIQRFGFDGESFDAVVFFGDRPDWPEAHHLKLFDERITACASPAFLQRHPVTVPEDLAHVPLLQLETRPTAWRTWFEAQGSVAATPSGMLIDQFSMMIQAAISGLGVALLPDYLACSEIEAGRLSPVLRPGIGGTGSYWLAWSGRKDRSAPLLAFRRWIASECGAPPEDAD